MKVLIVGGAGYVASVIRPAFEVAHDCYYFDRQQVPGVPGREERTTLGDVTDAALAQKAVAGMEGVIYMAMGAPPGSPFGIPGPRSDINMIAPAFGVNAGGIFAFLEAGLAAGVRRFVYASSLSVYSRDHPRLELAEDDPPNGWYGYAVSKQCGEMVCQTAGRVCPEATIVVLRLMAPRNAADYAREKQANPELLHLGPEDTSDLFLKSLACRRPGVHILHTTGDLREKHYRHARAKEILGWEPRGR